MGGRYYVYEHWRPDKDVCFYVGKGKGKRSSDMRRGRNRHHKFIQSYLSSIGMTVEVRLVAFDLTEEEAFKIEIDRILFWRTSGVQLCNVTSGGEGSSGIRYTEERKKLISDKLKGRVMSPDVRKKISDALRGNKNGLGAKKSREAVEKTAAAHRGKTMSADVRAKISASKKGKPGACHTPETIEKIRSRQLGVPKSEATKAKMRKPKSPEHRAKLSAINLGKTHSEETRKLLSEKAKLQWAVNPPRPLKNEEV